ncbi:hypothetical protein GALL_426500 [mine drainage metagenome]|uniref:Uncharacterized protein n=1 Tax=mine drainage metagenome TaxID=410659 RepID=A0A1J5Q735_9ZZZZ
MRPGGVTTDGGEHGEHALHHRPEHARGHGEDGSGRGGEPHADGHASRRLVRVRGLRRPRAGEEADTERLDHRRDADTRRERDRAHRERHRERDHRVALRRRMDQALQQQPLPDEPRAERQARRPHRADPEHGRRDRHRAHEPAQPVQVAQTRRREHRARGEEAEGFEGRVADEVHQRRCDRDRRDRRGTGRAQERRGAQRHRHEPHVLRRRVGEEPFEVGRDRGLQDTEHRGHRADGHQDEPPPRRARAEDLQVDADDPVDAHRDHRGAHQGGHRARRLGVRARQPRVQRQETRLRPEPDHGQQEHRGAGPRGHDARTRGEGREVVRATRCREHHQGDEDRDEAELRHDRVDDPCGPHGGASVVGEHERERRGGHQLPAQQERRDGPGRGDQDHGRDERREQGEGEHRPVLVARVADGVDTDDDGDSAGEGDQQPTERIDVEPDADERKEPAEAQMEPAAEDRRETEDQPRDPDRGRRGARHECASSRRRAHRPVTERSAATICAGVGGQPGTSTSTGTTSATDPTTP